MKIQKTTARQYILREDQPSPCEYKCSWRNSFHSSTIIFINVRHSVVYPCLLFPIRSQTGFWFRLTTKQQIRSSLFSQPASNLFSVWQCLPVMLAEVCEA